MTVTYQTMTSHSFVICSTGLANTRLGSYSEYLNSLFYAVVLEIVGNSSPESETGLLPHIKNLLWCKKTFLTSLTIAIS